MIEDSDGNYKQSTDSSFPGYEYFYNQSKSGCMSSNGKQIEDSLLYDQDNKKATVKVGQTSMCYLYFDKYKPALENKLIASGTLWQSELEGDGYRYVGTGTVGTDTNPKNFVCFGTTDKSECTANSEKYMYRIVGIFADANGNNHLKLIKYKQLDTFYAWNTDYETDISWENSDLFKGLNGNYFLTNVKYDYLQDSLWSDKIEDWTWSAVNTKNGSSYPSYFDGLTIKDIYLHEMNRTSKATTIGEWTNPVAKIGVMYASDVALSPGKVSLTSVSNNDIFTTGWLYPGNNDTTKSECCEWTMARDGNLFNDTFAAYGAYCTHPSGLSYNCGVDSTDDVAVRPVFYLKSNQVISEGIGTENDPYILDTDNRSQLSIKLSAKDLTLTAKFIKGSGNLTKYCYNFEESIDDCSWADVDSDSITISMSELFELTYYVHLIDDEGYITHASYTYKANWDDSKSLQENLINSGNLWQSGLKNDGYRYTGTGAYDSSTTPSNFICFGTISKSDCTTSPDKYIYRIIGVFNNHVKLIKYKEIGNSTWNANYTVDVAWENSSLYSALNGSKFLSNTTYVPNTTWSNLITNWTWSAVKNSSYSSYSAYDIYMDEMNINGTASDVSTPSAKIGLMYVSDFALSIGSVSAKSYDDSWLSNKNSGSSYGEWTMARYGTVNNLYASWTVGSDLYYDLTGEATLRYRPVFYLESSVKTSGGIGTLSDPYIINLS